MGANLKEIRNRIQSVNNTQQITKAMKMVSASKLRRAQGAITQMRPYADKLDEMLRNILSNMEGEVSSSFGVQRPIDKVCLVVVTSNKGLCGAFNANVIKAAIQAAEGPFAEALAAGKLTFLPIGKKGNEALHRRFPKANYNTEFVEVFNNLTFDNIANISGMLMDKFSSNEFDRVEVVYSFFKNAATQFPEVKQFLPVAKIESKDSKSTRKADYVFEPDKATLLEHLIPTILKTTFFKYLLDTHASEHGARMTSMDKATENAGELLKDLKLVYNRSRQEAITQELGEIVGGAAALEG